jgi:hypothetical protein
VLDNSTCAAGVVDVDRVEGSSLNGTVEENDGMAVGKVRHESLGVDVGGHDDDAVHSSPHGAHGALDFALVVVRVGDDEVITGPSCGDIDTANNLGEEFTVEVGKEDPDGAGAAGDEASSAAVGDITECGGDVANPAAGLFPNESTAVENTGDGGD